MHTFSDTGAGVPAFLAKLWRLVEDPETNNLIYWSKDGRSFIIQNQAQFARELLPLNYKHNNMASFIRQLNMYGFHKITSIDNGGLKFDRDEMEFTHPCFKRGCPYLLEHIKRKIANTKQHQQLIDDKAGIKVESVSKVLNEVKAMRGRQDSLDSRFSVMKQENEALWREIANLRQKHIKQQQIVNKLIQFLVTIVQPSRNMSGVKRTFQLMINDAPQSSTSRKPSESESGPVIHELTEELLDEVADVEGNDEDLMSGPPSPPMTTVSGETEPTHIESLSPRSNIERPNSNLSVSSQFYEQQSNQSIEDAKLFTSNTNSNGSNSENQWVYQIRELPESNEADSEPLNFVDMGILPTPMVKEEKTKHDNYIPGKQIEKNSRKRKHVRDSPLTVEYVKTPRNTNEQLNIKAEKNELDPLMFLKTPSPTNSCSLSPAIDSALMSSNTETTTNVENNSTENNDAHIHSNESDKNKTTQSLSQGKSMYEGDFLNTDMPSDLFEDSSMTCDINLGSTSLETQTPVPSTSKEIQSKIDQSGESNKKNDNEKNEMTVVKYSTQKSSEDIMKLQSPEDFHNHLDNVQDDLENLKDLLKGDSYSFDTTTLSGLFNDSDILGPYGLSMVNDLPDNNNGKTGSEVATYQAYGGFGDLSDILEINKDNNSELEEASSPRSRDGTSSVLNTPRPEPRKAPF
ncbi:heat shock factor protein isoform X2 [Condylostylus longicornis]|uniref:heat shock factor protein isoform X2 n=1 Tax=Condylostylus longicornis TaxID=2530218 RepID=UPI00244E02EE|nr:heat shock factor protein isoform X2 [Condylostylus longicornis]